MKRILFQGDSITDAGRSTGTIVETGWGYASMVAAKLGYDRPQEYEIINRGVSGNRIADLFARMKPDIINLKPDVLSLLIGVNDVWHELCANIGTSTELYETVYDLMLDEIRKALPDTRILILEPFCLEGSGTADYWPMFDLEVRKKAAAAKRVAERHGLEFVPLQAKFEKAAEIAPPQFWLADGVHPTAAGHEILTRAWLKAFDKDVT